MGQESNGTASRGNVKWWPSQRPRGSARRSSRLALRDHPPLLPNWLRACNGRPSAHPLALTTPCNVGLGSSGSGSTSAWVPSTDIVEPSRRAIRSHSLQANAREAPATIKPVRCNKAKEG